MTKGEAVKQKKNEKKKQYPFMLCQKWVVWIVEWHFMQPKSVPQDWCSE